MGFTEILGFVAATATTISFVPQAIKVIRTRNTHGISLLMYALFTTGMSLWLIYGIIIGSRPMIISNFITAILAAIIFVMTLRNQLRKYG